MKIDFISDLHIDFWKYPLHEHLDMDNDSEVLVIAGDLGHYISQDRLFLEECKKFYKRVLLVRGNHDMYLVSRKQQEKYKYNSWNRIKEYKEMCEEIGIDYLDGDVIEINGIKFGGVGMSWDASYLKLLESKTPETPESIKQMFERSMNDSKLIMSRKPPTYYGMYGKDILGTTFDPYKYFKEEYEKLSTIDDCDVMISHYGPVAPFEDMPYEFRYSPTSAFYYFDGRKDVKRIKPKIWVFGHTHDTYDFMYDETRLICNPLGYPGENGFVSVKTIKI